MNNDLLLDGAENVRRRRRPGKTRSCFADWRAVRAYALRPSLLTVDPSARCASVRHDNARCALSAENLQRVGNLDEPRIVQNLVSGAA